MARANSPEALRSCATGTKLTGNGTALTVEISFDDDFFDVGAANVLHHYSRGDSFTMAEINVGRQQNKWHLFSSSGVGAAIWRYSSSGFFGHWKV
jgi:hypothetical protein